jgi:predicted nucleic-acid-binding Zn-ribbon protein
MKNGKCPKCGSTEIYVSVHPFSDSISVKSTTKSFDVFETEAYLCLDCRKIEMYAAEYSAVLFGKKKILKESVPLSENWKKLQR